MYEERQCGLGWKLGSELGLAFEFGIFRKYFQLCVVSEGLSFTKVGVSRKVGVSWEKNCGPWNDFSQVRDWRTWTRQWLIYTRLVSSIHSPYGLISRHTEKAPFGKPYSSKGSFLDYFPKSLPQKRLLGSLQEDIVHDGLQQHNIQPNDNFI